MRFEPSGTSVGRWTANDVEIAWRDPAEKAVLCLVGAANRDERVFEDPDTFDLHRKIGHHLTFGYGRTSASVPAGAARGSGRARRGAQAVTDWEVDDEGCRMGRITLGVRGYEALPIVIT